MSEDLAKCPRKGEGSRVTHPLESPGLRGMPVRESSEEVIGRDILQRQWGGIHNGIIIGASAHCSPGMACVLLTSFNLYNKSMPVVKQVPFPPPHG